MREEGVGMQSHSDLSRMNFVLPSMGEEGGGVVMGGFNFQHDFK